MSNSTTLSGNLTRDPEIHYTKDGQPNATFGSRVIVSGRLEQHSWDTDSGDRRSRVELTADEVGPSLRFATAEVTRTVRRSPDGAGISGGSDLSADREDVGADA